MKTRLVTSLAVAALATFGLTGCGLMSPQSTLQPYSPSDGVEVNVAAMEVRNLMLITGSDAEEMNIVFGVMNNGSSAAKLGFRFVDADGAEIGSVDVQVEPGYTSFGDLRGDFVTTELPGLKPGAMVVTYVQTPGGEQQIDVPILDGALRDVDGTFAFPEYVDLVP